MLSFRNGRDPTSGCICESPCIHSICIWFELPLFICESPRHTIRDESCEKSICVCRRCDILESCGPEFSSDGIISPRSDWRDDSSGRDDDSEFCILSIPCGRRSLYRSGRIDHDICRRGCSDCDSPSGILSLHYSDAICSRSNTNDKSSIRGEFI